MSSQTTSALADHYLALGREEKAAAIRTWLQAVKKELKKEHDQLQAKVNAGSVQYQAEAIELRGGIAIIEVLLQRMNEASDAAPASAPAAGA